MAKISDLQPRQGKINIKIKIVSVGEIYEFDKPGFSGKVATAVAKDDSGQIDLTLWNTEIEIVKKGDVVHITNGYVNEFQGKKQLTAGRFGKLEVVSIPAQ